MAADRNWQPGLDFDEYIADEGLNGSTLKAGRVSMRHMRHYVENGLETTPAMETGTNVHSCVLEPERFFDSFSVWEGGRRAGAAWDSFKTIAGMEGKIIVKPEELADYHAITASVHANREAHRLIESTQHEVSIFWEDRGLGKGKARIDAIDDKVTADLKTAASIEEWAFVSHCYKFGYHIQLGWQRYGLRLLGREPKQFALIAVEKKPPFDCVVYWPDDAFLDEGERQALEIAKRFRIAQYTNSWPGISDEPLPLSLPRYVAGEPKQELVIGGEKVEV